MAQLVYVPCGNIDNRETARYMLKGVNTKREKSERKKQRKKERTKERKKKTEERIKERTKYQRITRTIDRNKERSLLATQSLWLWNMSNFRGHVQLRVEQVLFAGLNTLCESRKN